MALAYNKLIFELNIDGVDGLNLEEPKGLAIKTGLPRREKIGLPSVAEPDVVRHYTRRSMQNFGRDNVPYPLGSCTMKYNPRINEAVAREAGFSRIHPLQPVETIQGALQVIYELQEKLAQLTGLPSVSLLPSAGAHAEFVSLMMIKAYHNSDKRNIILIPDSAHGTNPASAMICGYQIVNIPSNENGTVDVQRLIPLVNDQVAALMITNPNTCGVFEDEIAEIAEILHKNGALLYCDGANFNAIVGKVSPALLGVDIMHINLHKTFSTPHGGGGPGGGVVCAIKDLNPYLPIPVVSKGISGYFMDTDRPQSVGRVCPFQGGFGVTVRALSYILSLGEDMKKVAEQSVLNANYILNQLIDLYDAPFGNRCMHECLLTDKKQAGITTNDIAKYLIDQGIHPMTVYFPLIVKGAMLIEPTETESLATLDHFIQVMRDIAQAVTKGELQKFIGLPRSTPVKKVDETLAARQPKLTF